MYLATAKVQNQLAIVLTYYQVYMYFLALAVYAVHAVASYIAICMAIDFVK